MTIAQLFRKFFGPVEREAGIVAHHIEADAHSAVQLTEKEKEIIMAFSQAFQDALDHIKAVFAGHAADAQTISGLSAQVSDLTVQCRDKESQVGALTQQLSDAQAQLADAEAAVVAAANDAPAPAPAPTVDPAAAPADGSASADPTP